MNLYLLEAMERDCATSLCDQHVRQCARDYPRFLTAAYATYVDEWGVRQTRKSFDAKKFPEPALANHPITEWVCKDIANWMFAAELTSRVWEEYKYRYGHESEQQQKYALQFNMPAWLPSKTSTPTAPIQYMPKAYYCDEKRDGWSNAIIAYRDYYVLEVSAFARWEHGRKPPIWYTERMFRPALTAAPALDTNREFRGIKRIRA